MKLTHTVGGIALSLGIGCAPAPQSPPEVNAAIQRDLARLTARQIVAANQLILKTPGDTERARQAARLDKLATIAEEAVHNQYLTPHTASEADAAVEALSALQIVQVDGLVKVEPANNW